MSSVYQGESKPYQNELTGERGMHFDTERAFFSGMVIELDEEYFSNISVSDSSIVFTSGSRFCNDVPITYEYSLTRDSDGKILSMTDSVGHVTTITRS